MTITKRQTNETLRSDIWRACDILRRDNNVGGVVQYTEHLAWLLFLKFLDEEEKERLAMASLGEGEHYEPVLQGDLAWDAWAGPDKLGTWKVEDLIQFVRGRLLPGLSTLTGSPLARTMGVRALIVDYRLAPEHPYPAALDDCITAYRWLLKQGIPPQNMVLAGDSAGGNLAITTMMKLRAGGEPLPAAAACLSPVADLTERRPARFKDPLLPPEAVRFYSASYVAQGNARDPLISPVYGDWHGLPPLLVHVGEEEMLRDDAARSAAAARAAGVDVRLETYPRMWHVWQLFLALPQARASLDDIARFLVSHLGPGMPTWSDLRMPQSRPHPAAIAVAPSDRLC